MTESEDPQGLPLETEVKLRVPSLDGLGARLEAQGFHLETPFQAETSTLWDRGAELYDQGAALRIRRYGGSATVTWKGAQQADPRFKIRPELETAVADAAAMEGILRALGFTPVMRMVKQRAVYRREALVACLDETPFGCFLEVEGPPEDLPRAIEALTLPGAEVETRSYPALFREHGLA